jgi:HAMP domain-containing protein
MLSNLKLAPKFTVLLSLVFITAIAISGALLSQTTLRNAENNVAYRGEILMEVMNSARHYTDSQVNPLLEPRIETSKEFIPQAIPSYSVIQIFEGLRKNSNYKDYFYKDAMLNPTNLRDKADDFEAEIVKQFRQNTDVKEISGFSTRKGEKVFYYAQPIVITKQSCLRCHSTPEQAPESQLAIYGSKNGFGWQLNKVLGAQTIYVPSQRVFAIARRSLALTMGIFIGIFALVILLINFLLKRTVIQPVRPMARLAHKLSNDSFDGDLNKEYDIASLEKAAKNSDELGQLARLFQQMAHAVYVREQSFAEQLQQLRTKSEEMQGRTQSKNNRIAYFKALQQKAQAIRNRAQGSS